MNLLSVQVLLVGVQKHMMAATQYLMPSSLFAACTVGESSKGSAANVSRIKTVLRQNGQRVLRLTLKC
jgi:hypothetical protein